MFRRFVIFFTIAIVLALSVGAVTAHEGEAHVRIGHFAVGAPNIDVFFNGTGYVGDLPYLAVSPVIELEPGDYQFIVTQHNAGIDAAMIDLAMTLEAGHNYSIYALGQISEATPKPTPLFVDETTLIEEAGLSESVTPVVVVNALNGYPGFDILLDDQMFMDNVAFGEARAGEFPLPLVTVNVTVAGQRDQILVEAQFFGMPNATTLAVLAGVPESYFPIFYSHSDLGAGEWLAAAGQSSPFYQFNTLVTAIGAIRDVPEIQNLMVEEDSTFFAPVDAAFAALPEGTVDDLLANPDTLAKILLYHGIQGPLYSHDILAGLAAGGGTFTVTTAEGSDLTITPPSPDAPLFLLLNGSTHLVFSNVSVANGIIHMIDGVLMPPDLAASS